MLWFTPGLTPTGFSTPQVATSTGLKGLTKTNLNHIPCPTSGVGVVDGVGVGIVIIKVVIVEVVIDKVC